MPVWRRLGRIDILLIQDLCFFMKESRSWVIGKHVLYDHLWYGRYKASRSMYSFSSSFFFLETLT
jgi:hypothetical protein